MKFHADSLVGVIFIERTAHQDDALQLWGKTFGGTPDSFNKSTATPLLQTTASGLRHGHNLTLVSQVGRVDVILNAAVQPGFVPQSGPMQIVDVEQGIERLAQVLKQLDVQFRVNRLSIVLDLSRMVPSGAEASVLLEALSGVGIPDGSSEIVLQFNKPRPFSLDANLTMNRLCNWSSGIIQMMTTAPGSRMSAPTSISAYAGLKADINTSADHSIVSMDRSIIIDELRDEALEVYKSGYKRFI